MKNKVEKARFESARVNCIGNDHAVFLLDLENEDIFAISLEITR